MDGTMVSHLTPNQPAFSSFSPTTTPYVPAKAPYNNPLLTSTGSDTGSDTGAGVVVQWVLSLMGEDGDEDAAKRWSSFIGIIVAISGNVLISLALNVQKYAHIRLQREKSQRKQLVRRRRKELAWKRALAGIGTAGQRVRRDTNEDELEEDVDGIGQLDGDETPEDDDADLAEETSGLINNTDSERNDQMYLHSPLWWMGLVLMTVGECGNFLAYGFAPASIVSPLGVVALISNCIIAPMMLKEPFRGRDILGVFVSIAGAVIVVLSSAPEEVKLGPDEILDAISQTAFEVYFGITCIMMIALMYISARYGSKFIMIDLGLVALFGGYTVLSTKGISSLLSTSLYHIFTMPIAYLFAFVLVATAILQIKYVNRALQRFDSTQVIPTQFVLFTLSVIIGSGILYRDFEKISQDRLTKFVFGCGFTFLGVYLITSGRVTRDDDDDDLGVEEGDIGLVEGDGGASEATSHNGSIGRHRGRGALEAVSTYSADGAASPQTSDGYRTRTSSRPSAHGYRSSHSVAVTVRSLELDITESSPLLEHHPRYNSASSSLHTPTTPSFPIGGNLITSSNTPHRHSISLMPGPIVLGYQFQAVVADHVGGGPPPHGTSSSSKRRGKTLHGKRSSIALAADTGELPPLVPVVLSQGVTPRYKEPEDACSSGDESTALTAGPGTQLDSRDPGASASASARVSVSGRGKGIAVRGRRSSLHMVMDYVNGSGEGRARKRGNSVGEEPGEEEGVEER